MEGREMGWECILSVGVQGTGDHRDLGEEAIFRQVGGYRMLGDCLPNGVYGMGVHTGRG